jgi:hypothetical protein
MRYGGVQLYSASYNLVYYPILQVASLLDPFDKLILVFYTCFQLDNLPILFGLLVPSNLINIYIFTYFLRFIVDINLLAHLGPGFIGLPPFLGSSYGL